MWLGDGLSLFYPHYKGWMFQPSFEPDSGGQQSDHCQPTAPEGPQQTGQGLELHRRAQPNFETSHGQSRQGVEGGASGPSSTVKIETGNCKSPLWHPPYDDLMPAWGFCLRLLCQGSANEKEGTSVSQMTPVFIVKALKCQACGGREVFDEVILK